MGFQLCSLKNSTFKTILSTFFKVNICFFQKHFSLLVFQTCYRYLRSFFIFECRHKLKLPLHEVFRGVNYLIGRLIFLHFNHLERMILNLNYMLDNTLKIKSLLRIVYL